MKSYLFLLSIFACISLQAQLSPPNFVVILCDDLGYGDLACYGHPHIKTPHLDHLAKNGTKFTDCYASAPVCSSSRAGLLTGRTPNRTGVYDWIPNNHVVHLKPSEITLATLLRDAGYDTAHSGKWHLNGKFNSDQQPQPGDHGFNHWFATQNNASPSHENPKNFVRNGKAVGNMEGFACQLVADEAVNWLKNGRDKSKNFFLNIWFHEPHEPVASPKSMVENYLKVTDDVNQAQYFANVENMDAACGKLIKALHDLDLYDNTVIFFTSDNGPETLRRYRGAGRSFGVPGPLRGMKLHIYDGGIRVPGILHWPGKTKAGHPISEPISAVDLLPTFCQAAYIHAPKDRALDGTNFLPALRGDTLCRKTPLFWNYYRAIQDSPKVAMRDGDWKLVAHWDGPSKPLGGNVNPDSMKLIKTAKLTKFELYNIRKDIGEKKDLSKAEPDRLNAMTEALQKKYLEVQNESPVWEF